MIKQLTAIIEREGDGYFALCPESGHRESGRERVRGPGQFEGSAGAVLRDGFGLTKSNVGSTMKCM